MPAPARTLAAPLRALARARRVAPLLYFELGTSGDPATLAAPAERRRHERAVSVALARAVGSLLRRNDRVVTGPGRRWFAALLLDRAVRAADRAAVSDADLGVVAGRLRAAIAAQLDAGNGKQLRSSAPPVAVRAGWTIIEPRDLERPLTELRHALRGAAVVARIEERRGAVLAAVTHELRTPLTSIVGFSERLRLDRRAMPKRSVTRALAIIEEEAHRLRRLVDGLIDIGALHAGRLELRRVRAALGPVVRQAARLIAGQARDKRVRVTIRGAAKSYVDADRLLQIVVNLLDNAVRHAPDGGVVAVTIARSPSGSKISVSDDGPGFDPRLGARLGTPFGIGAGGRIGLGLAIAGMLCAAHEGAIRFGRSRLGGARVVVTLPH